MIQVPYYKGLVVCGKRLRSQWRAEARRFFPEALVEAVDARHLRRDMHAVWQRAVEQNRPMLLIVSYDTVRTQVDELARAVWDDLIVDEATVLKNPNSERCRALWRLRETSHRGVALTGTPIEKDLDDIGNILAWVRCDRAMFHGVRLSERYDPQKQTGAGSVQELWRSFGPTVFRRDRSEIADELPKIQTETILLDPEPAERKLADAARRHLKTLLEQLQARIDAAAALDPDDPRLKEAKREFRAVRNLVPSGITLARMAACDPVAVEQSPSAAAELLRGQGLVAPAVRTGGTKRQQIVGLTQELVENGEAVLIFTDFTTIADRLIDELRACGVRVASIRGGMSDKATTDAQDGFQGGVGGAIGPDTRYDCLVLTRTAKEGLNLQRASVLIHFDLPWLASDLVQRVGRASRIGATADALQVLIPVMAGTIEEHAAKKLVTRAVTALAVLDDPRGVRVSETEMAMAVSGLTEAVPDSELEAGEESMLDFARSLLNA